MYYWYVVASPLGWDGVMLMMIVFSAPKYCDSTENKGAYIDVGPDYKLVFHKFDAVPHPNVPAMVCQSPHCEE